MPGLEVRGLGLGQRLALLGLHARAHVHARHLDQQRQVREGGPELAGDRGEIRSRVEQRVAEDRLVPGGELALHLAAGRGGTETVELVEQARDGVRSLGVELDGRLGALAHEQEPRLLRRHDLREPVGGGAPSLRGGHLPAADVEELVREVERRLAVEHLAADGVGAVPGAARGGQVLAVRLDRHPEQAPLRGPLEVPRQLGRPAEGRDAPGPATARGPGHQVRPAGDGDRLAVPVGCDRGADPAAVGTHDAQRQPVLGVLDVGNAAVDVPHDGGTVERRADERVHLPRGVDVAHPVVAVRVDAEAREHVDERLRVVACVGGVAVARLIGNVRQRHAHVAVDRIGRQQRLGVHGVEVVHAVQERGLETACPQRARDDVEDDRSAEAADMHRSRRRLGVVDDLRTLNARRQLVGPIHGAAPLSGTCTAGLVPSRRLVPAAGP